jgi:pyruvate dehydrogenase E2 component (dihydrolipoamide acetyltransferase)
MQEGMLATWHVEEGTEITPGDDIMDVETDKIANIVEAADGGLLRRRVGQEGVVYPVRALLGVMAPASVSDADVNAYIEAYEMPEPDDDELAAEPTYEFADLPVGRIRYAQRTGDGTPVILIHGFGGNLDNWLFNIDALAEKVPTYALDLPGHGQSAKAVENPDLDLMVSTVVAFMNHIKINNAHLVGHSMGGLIASKIAIDKPVRVASVSLIGSAGLGEEINSAYIDGFVSAANRRELKPELLHLFADGSLVNRSMVDDVLKYKRLDGVQDFLKALSGNLFNAGKQSVQLADDLSTVTCPVQIIWGENDAVIPCAHADTVGSATVTVIENAGHMVQMEQASRVNELLKSSL